MIKFFLAIAALVQVSFGFEISRDTLVSKWVNSDSVWFINKTAQPIKIKNIYLKKKAGRTGDGLVFKISNEKHRIFGDYSHSYFLQSRGDSLFVQPGSWSQNPEIVIPSKDSITIKSVIYGTCIFCVSTNPQFEFEADLFFVDGQGTRTKLFIAGQYMSGGVVRKTVTAVPGRSGTGSGVEYLINGRTVRTLPNQGKTKPELIVLR